MPRCNQKIDLIAKNQIGQQQVKGLNHRREPETVQRNTTQNGNKNQAHQSVAGYPHDIAGLR